MIGDFAVLTPVEVAHLRSLACQLDDRLIAAAFLNSLEEYDPNDAINQRLAREGEN